jgi:hypothetical protein
VNTGINGVSVGSGRMVGVGGGVEVAVKDDATVGVDGGGKSGEATVTLGKSEAGVASGLIGPAEPGDTSSLDVAVGKGPTPRVGVTGRLT